MYLVEGGDSGWRIGYQHAPLGKGGPWLREGLWKPRFAGRPAYLLPPICNIEDGPSGLTYYPGTGLTPEYAAISSSRISRAASRAAASRPTRCKQNGASFVPTSSQQFIGGVLPTDVTFGPDGVLYLSDWVDGWPKSNKGRIYGITPVNPDPAQAKVSADLAKLLADGFTKKSTKELIALLGHPDRRARLEAHLELASRDNVAVSTFADVADRQIHRSARTTARHLGPHGLGQAQGRRAQGRALAHRLLADKDAEVRAQAAKSLGISRSRAPRAHWSRRSATPNRACNSSPRRASARSAMRRRRSRCSRCCAPTTTRTPTCVSRLRMRCPGFTRTRRLRRPRRTPPPPCDSACCSRIGWSRIRRSRAFSTTPDRVHRARGRRGHQRCADRAGAGAARRQARQRAGGGRGPGDARAECQLPAGRCAARPGSRKLCPQCRGHCGHARRGADAARALGQGAAARSRGGHLSSNEGTPGDGCGRRARACGGEVVR